jgi:OOP family OmpA-OmpF porin
MPYLAIEGGYTRIGDVEATLGAARAEVEGFGIPVYAVGILPLLEDRLWLFGKAGAVYWDGELEATGPGGRITDSDSGVSFAFGAGVQYNVTPMFGVRAEYEVFHDVGDDDGVNGDVHMWSVGAVVRF